MNVILSISGAVAGLVVGWSIISLITRFVELDRMRSPRVRFWLGLMTVSLMILGGVWGYRLP